MTRAIWVHKAEPSLGGDIQVMNYSSMDDDGKAVYGFLVGQHDLTLKSESRGSGHARHKCSIVTDLPALIAAARAAGVELANEWVGWGWPK